ncbi:hypothetical protein ABZ442_15180 [Streptomyces triculaminicus]|uniref:hypothetical protein n=1 Tax=Streptomyces triculaminicus TaxID=2816232 RepID=UPI0033E17A46
MRLEAAVAVLTLGRFAINSIRRAVAAAAAGILLALGSVVVAAPAHADDEVANLICAALRAGYSGAELKGCPPVE